MFTYRALRVGQTVPIALQLFDGATNKYVKATVTKADGTAISGSPFSVPHETGGLYKLNSQVMPSTEFLTVQYKVYDDAGFTTPSTDHGDALDVFSKAEDFADQSQLSGLISQDIVLSGIMESNTLVGTVEECGT